MLMFKKCYFEAIRAGAKTATLRYWSRRMVKPGSVHLAPGLGRLRIESVQPRRLEDLTEADARDDGFDSVAQLRAALAELYADDARRSRSLYQVRFSYLGRADRPA